MFRRRIASSEENPSASGQGGHRTDAIKSSLAASLQRQHAGRTAFLSHKDLLLLKSKLLLLKDKGAKFHSYQAEWTVALSIPPARAQELAISALSCAILVFALLLNSVASTVFAPKENLENSGTAFAFNVVLGAVFSLAAASTLFLTYMILLITLDHELGAWRQMLRYEQLAEPFLWMTAYAQMGCVALGILGSAHAAETAERLLSAEYGSFLQLGSTSASGKEENNRFWSWVTIAVMLFVFQAKFLFFYVQAPRLAPIPMRHWAYWLAPFVLKIFPGNAEDCARLGPLYARMIVQNVADHFGVRLFPYDPFFWPDVGFLKVVYGDAGGGGGLQLQQQVGAESVAGKQLFAQWCKLLAESGMGSCAGEKNKRGKWAEQAAGAGPQGSSGEGQDVDVEEWHITCDEFFSQHQVELIATALVEKDLDSADMASLSDEYCCNLLDEAIPLELATPGQKLKLAKKIRRQ